MQHSEPNRSRPYAMDLSDARANSQTFDGTDVAIEHLFRYWDKRFALKSFLMDFPEVSSKQALAALRKRAESEIPADSDNGLIGGMSVFSGTRVPVEYLFNLLKPAKI